MRQVRNPEHLLHRERQPDRNRPDGGIGIDRFAERAVVIAAAIADSARRGGRTPPAARTPATGLARPAVAGGSRMPFGPRTSSSPGVQRRNWSGAAGSTIAGSARAWPALASAAASGPVSISSRMLENSATAPPARMSAPPA